MSVDVGSVHLQQFDGGRVQQPGMSNPGECSPAQEPASPIDDLEEKFLSLTAEYTEFVANRTPSPQRSKSVTGTTAFSKRSRGGSPTKRSRMAESNAPETEPEAKPNSSCGEGHNQVEIPTEDVGDNDSNKGRDSPVSFTSDIIETPTEVEPAKPSIAKPRPNKPAGGRERANTVTSFTRQLRKPIAVSKEKKSWTDASRLKAEELDRQLSEMERELAEMKAEIAEDASTPPVGQRRKKKRHSPPTTLAKKRGSKPSPALSVTSIASSKSGATGIKPPKPVRKTSNSSVRRTSSSRISGPNVKRSSIPRRGSARRSSPPKPARQLSKRGSGNKLPAIAIQSIAKPSTKRSSSKQPKDKAKRSSLIPSGHTHEGRQLTVTPRSEYSMYNMLRKSVSQDALPPESESSDHGPASESSIVASSADLTEEEKGRKAAAEESPFFRVAHKDAKKAQEAASMRLPQSVFDIIVPPSQRSPSRKVPMQAPEKRPARHSMLARLKMRSKSDDGKLSAMVKTRARPRSLDDMTGPEALLEPRQQPSLARPDVDAGADAVDADAVAVAHRDEDDFSILMVDPNQRPRGLSDSDAEEATPLVRPVMSPGTSLAALSLSSSQINEVAASPVGSPHESKDPVDEAVKGQIAVVESLVEQRTKNQVQEAVSSVSPNVIGLLLGPDAVRAVPQSPEPHRFLPWVPSVLSRPEVSLLEQLARSPVVKFGRHGKPKKKWITITETHIYWDSKLHESGEYSGQRKVAMKDIVTVTRGKATKVFQQKQARHVPENVCFSICAKSRTVDLQAGSVAERNGWVDILSKSIIFANRKNLRTRSNTIL